MSQRGSWSGGDSCAAAASRTLLALSLWSVFALVVTHYVALAYRILVRPSNFGPSHSSEGCDLELLTSVFLNGSCFSRQLGSGSHFELTPSVTSPHVASEYRLLDRPSIIDPSHITAGCDLVGRTFVTHNAFVLLKNPTLLSSYASIRAPFKSTSVPVIN